VPHCIEEGKQKKKEMCGDIRVGEPSCKSTECGISQLTAAHFVGGHILGN
jgi:hypothetical protein